MNVIFIKTKWSSLNLEFSDPLEQLAGYWKLEESGPLGLGPSLLTLFLFVFLVLSCSVRDFVPTHMHMQIQTPIYTPQQKVVP